MECATCIKLEQERDALKAQLREYAGWSPHQFTGLLAEHRALQAKYIALDTEKHELRKEVRQLLDELQHAVIERDMKFWRWYADETCKNLAESNGKLTRLLGETGQEWDALRAELAEAQRYAVAESSKAHQEIVELRKDRDRLLEAAKDVLANEHYSLVAEEKLKAAVRGR